MSVPTFETFKSEQHAIGCDEVIERRWESGVTIDTHTHPFSVRALVVMGDMWLTIGQDTRHLRPGDRFEVDADVPHAERYGDSGATFWVARTARRKI